MNRTTIAQVNTENLRRSDLIDGFFNNLQFDFGYISGNSDLLILKSGFRTDFISGDYNSFMVFKYQRQIQNHNLFINKGFIHIRSISVLTSRFRWELFVQKEFDDFILLKDRNLIGVGLRTALLLPDSTVKKSRSVHLHIGTGAMWENEEINSNPIYETKIFRSTNYISLRWSIDERVNLGIVGYYQFHLSDFQNYRFLFEGKLDFTITKSLAFQTGVYLRYDNGPPKEVKKYDLEITNGFNFSF